MVQIPLNQRWLSQPHPTEKTNLSLKVRLLPSLSAGMQSRFAFARDHGHLRFYPQTNSQSVADHQGMHLPMIIISWMYLCCCSLFRSLTPRFSQTTAMLEDGHSVCTKLGACVPHPFSAGELMWNVDQTFPLATCSTRMSRLLQLSTVFQVPLWFSEKEM